MITKTVNFSRFFVAVPLLLTIVSVARAQGGWAQFKINTGGNDLNTVYFLDSKRGWVGGDGGFLSRTDDSGLSWVRQTVPTTAAINDIYFRDKEAGFLLAGKSIFITRDGTNWTQSRIFLPEEVEGADVELYSVRFSSKKKGWVVGSVSKRERVVDSILVYTDDGGATWTQVSKWVGTTGQYVHADIHAIKWYDNGNKKSEGVWAEDTMHDKWNYWDKEGRLIKTEEWFYGNKKD